MQPRYTWFKCDKCTFLGNLKGIDTYVHIDPENDRFKMVLVFGPKKGMYVANNLEPDIKSRELVTEALYYRDNPTPEVPAKYW